VTAAPGNYLLLLADFRLDPAEAESGINTNDNFGPPTGFVGEITLKTAVNLSGRRSF